MKKKQRTYPVCFPYFGGKAVIRSWINSFLPKEGKLYCEPFAGAASVLLSRDPVNVEVLNDINGHIVNLFRVLQDEELTKILTRKLHYTPYSLAEFRKAEKKLRDFPADTYFNPPDVEVAWAFYTFMNQSFSGSPGGNREKISWSYSRQKNKTNQWVNKVDDLDRIVERLRRVVITQEDGIQCIQRFDCPEAVFYVDPPYVLDTRKGGKVYIHETDGTYHERLVSCLLEVKGFVALSGYEHPVYDRLLEAGWTVRKKNISSFAAGRCRSSGIMGEGSAKNRVPRTECLYVNKQVMEG